MTRERIDWAQHIVAYKDSQLPMSTYCENAGIKITTFRHHVYKKPARQKTAVRKTSFKEFKVTAPELIVSRSETGELTLRGFEPAQLSVLIGAWSHALSH